MGKSHDHSHEKIEDEQIPQESKIMEKNNKNEEVKQRENISKNKKSKYRYY